MPLLNIAENLKIGTMQVLRVMNRLEQVWPPLLCVTFTDDFERLLLGPTWTDGPVFDFGSFTPVIDNSINTGAYVAGENDEPAPVTVLGTIRTTARYPGDQFVEATVGNFFQGHDPCVGEQYQWVEGEMWLFTQIASDSNACLGVYVIIQVNQGPGDTGGCYMQIISVAPDGTRDYFGDGTFFPLIDWQTNPNYTIRLETTAAGHCKALFEGRVVVEDDVVPIGGPHVGLAQQWNRTSYGGVVELVSFNDEFDRADGPIGPDWIAVTENGNYDWVEMPLSIQGGAAIGVDGTGALPEEFSGGMWHTEMSGDQYIEVCVTGLQYRSNYPIGQRKHGQIRLFCQANTIDPAKEELWVEWSDDDAVGGQRRMDCYPVLPDGSYHDESTFFQNLSPWAPALSDPTACIRLEALADGTRRVYFTLGTTGAVDLVGEGTAPLNNVGPYVGFRMFWWRGTGEGGTSPRVLWARGGELPCDTAAWTTWRDDFARANGALGAEWTAFTPPVLSRVAGATSIVSGAMQWDRDIAGGSATCSAVRPVQSFPGEKMYVEASITNCWPVGVQWNLILVTGINLVDRSCVRAYFGPIRNGDGTGDLGWGVQYVNAAGVDQATFLDGFIEFGTINNSRAITCRLERTDSHYRVLIDGVLQGEADLPLSGIGGPISGDFVGHNSEWFRSSGTDTGPRVEWFGAGSASPGVCTSGCEVWRDDFERADGPVGADWTLGFGTGSGEDRVLPTIASGAAICEGRVSGAPTGAKVGTMSWVNEVDAADQYLEVTFDNWHLTTNGSSTCQIEGYVLGDPALGAPDAPFFAPSRRAFGFWWRMIDGGKLTVSAYTYLDDGNTTNGEFVQYGSVGSPYSGPTGVRTLRLESYADGRQVVMLDGNVVIDYVETEAPWAGAGRTQGIWMSWLAQAGDSSPRILSTSGGSLTGPMPNTGTSPRFEAVTGGQLCEVPCGECILDVMGAAAWQGLEGSDTSGYTGPKLLAYDAAGDFYYQTYGNMAGNIWPEMVMPPVSVEATFGNIGNVSTPTPADPDITDYCSVELWRRDNFQYGDGLRVVIQVWDAGFAYDDTPFPPGWYWWIEWYEDVVAHDYIYEFYPDDNVLGRPGLGGDEFTVRLQVGAAGEVIFSVDGVEYHRATIDAALLPTGPGRFGFWMDRGSGGFVTVPPPDDAPFGSAVCMSLNPCP